MFKRINQDEHRTTGVRNGPNLYKPVSPWLIALVGLAVLGVLGGATAGFVVAMGITRATPSGDPASGDPASGDPASGSK